MNTTFLNHRVSWIDICRGVAILLVLYGHLFNTDNQRYLIYAFHMPLFFFISGLVFKPPSQKSIIEISKKYSKQLLIPYVIFALLTYLFAFVSHTAGDISFTGILYQLFGIVYGNGNDGMLGYNVVLWFLPCLFITKLTFALLTRITKKGTVLSIVLGIFAVSGALVSYFLPWVKLPFGFEVALIGITFFGAGYVVMSNKKRVQFILKQKILLAITAILLTILAAKLNYHISGYQVDMRIGHIGNFFLFYLASFSGIITCMTISKIIATNAFFEYLGRHSMVLFAWHNILFVDLENIINTVFDHSLINTINFLMPTFYVCCAISIILLTRILLTKLTVAYRNTDRIRFL